MDTYLHSSKLARRSNGLVNGTLEGDTFTRKVSRNLHFVWKYKGYGIDALQLESLHRAGVVNIRFVERDTKAEYIATVSEWLEHGVRDQLGKYEPQIFFPCASMSKIEPLNYHSQAIAGVRYESGGETFTHVPDYKQESLF